MISSLTLYQDNKVGDSNLMPVHSPLIFLIDAVYSGSDPYYIYCKIYDGETLLNTFKCIPYKDLTTTNRRFMFIADSILRGYMDSYEDFYQSESALEFVEDITKEFTLSFEDPDGDADSVTLDIVALHGVSQFGEAPNKTDIYNNEPETIIAAKGQPCYVYFYNNNITNIIGVSIPSYEVVFKTEYDGAILEGVDITINGETKSTNTSGEATFSLREGTYNYTVEKEGYITKTGSLILENDLYITFDMELVTTVNLTIITGYDNDIVKIYDQSYQPLDPRTVLYQGTTDATGEVTLEVQNNKTYYIDVERDHKLCTSPVGGIRDDMVEVLDVDVTKTISAAISNWSSVKDFIVRSALDGTLIENAELTKDGSDFFGNCNSEIYYSNINGEITADNSKIYSIYDVRTDTELTDYGDSIYFDYHITKTGYGIATGQVQKRTTTTIKTVYI